MDIDLNIVLVWVVPVLYFVSWVLFLAMLIREDGEQNTLIAALVTFFWPFILILSYVTWLAKMWNSISQKGNQ